MGTQTKKGEIYIGGTYFNVLDPVRLANITVPPNPILFGDTSKQSDTQVESQLSQSSWIGGCGVYKGNSRTDTERSWATELDDRWRDTLTRPPKAYSLGIPSDISPIGPLVWTRDFQDEQYFGFGSRVYRYVFATSTWALETILPANPIDAVVFDSQLFISYGSGYAIRATGGGWSTVSSEVSYWTIHDGKIWRLGRVAATSRWTLYSSLDGAAWTLEGSFSSEITPSQLLTFRDADGLVQVYATTNYGLYIWDDTNNVWKNAQLLLPRSTDALKAVLWRDAKLYMTTGGLGMASIQPGNPLVIEAMGLDRDDGVPMEEAGSLIAIESDINWILAIHDATTAVALPAIHHSSYFGPVFASSGDTWPYSQGPAMLRAWSGGWHKLYTNDTARQARPVIYVSSAGGFRRVYFSLNGEAQYQDIPSTLYNPRRNPTPHYQGADADEFEHITPWWSYGSDIQKKVHGHFFLETKNCSASHWVKVYYATGLDDSTWTLLSTIITDGRQELKVGGNAGLQGQWFRFKFVMNGNTSSDTVSQEIRLYTSETMRVLPATYTYGVVIDLSRPSRDKSPTQLLAAIQTLMNPDLTVGLYEISYKDPYSPSGSQQSRYGRVMRYNGEEYTGGQLKGQGTAMLSLVIPYEQDKS